MHRCLFILLTFCSVLTVRAQQVTGTWEGRMGNSKVEVKIIQKGDSLTGTSYYYAGSHYSRYSIKGYFDPETNEVVWWDDQLIEDKSRRGLLGGTQSPLLSRADFNCPGGGRMMLEGKTDKKEDRRPGGKVYLEKTENAPLFPDEWDFVIDNYTVGANDPDLIDSVGLIAMTPAPPTVSKPEIIIEKPTLPGVATRTPVEVAVPVPPRTTPAAPVTIEEKFTIRKKVFTAELPLTGDSIELRFYDNVQVDGDSITLFLNEKLLFTHIRLLATPFVIKLSVKDLNDTNELTMVAENLGAIPPNTAFMVAIVDGRQYEVNLSSTEETSGMIRLRKPPKP